MSSPNYFNNAISQLFDDIEQKCHVKFNTFTANDKPLNKGINADQEYMQMYQEAEDNRTYKYLYDPDLNFDFRFHQRMARINYGKRKGPWCSLIFNNGAIKPLTNVLSHVYTGMEYVEYQEKEKDGTIKSELRGAEYQFRRVASPCNFVLISNEMSYAYQVAENMAMYFDRFINFTYKQHLQFSPWTEKEYELVGDAKNIRQVNLEKLDTESKGSLCMLAFSFELVYWDIWMPDKSYGLLQRVILEVHEAKNDKLLFIDIVE